MPDIFELNIGHLRVCASETRLVVADRRQGSRGRHLTMYYQPETRRGRKRFTPHVTTPPTGKVRFPFSGAAARRFVERFEGDLFARWVANSTAIDLDALAGEGWTVPVADMALLEKWKARLHVDGPRYRLLRDSESEEFAEDMLARQVTPAELKYLPPLNSPLTAIRIRKGKAESFFLSLYPEDWAGGPAGWYRTPIDWLPPNDFFRLFLEAGGPGLQRGIAAIFRLFRLGDFDKVLRESGMRVQ